MPDRKSKDVESPEQPDSDSESLVESGGEDERSSEIPEDDTETPSESSDASERSISSISKSDLLDCLDCVQATGSFADRFTYSTFPNPGLEIKGLGLIGLPLSEYETRRIFQHFQNQPSAELPTWRAVEIGSSKITLKNAAWHKFLGGTILKQIVEGLGLESPPSSINVELVKLLLHEAGTTVDPNPFVEDDHITSRKIGSLMIVLPSKHNGGAIRVRHESESQDLDTSTYSDYGLSAVAWYADTTAAASSVTSGCRLMLSYNLCLTNANKFSKSAAQLTEQKKILHKTLSKWDFGSKLCFLYMLDDQYTTKELSMDSLGGHDEVIIKLLTEVGPSAGCYVFLGQVEHTKNRDPEYDDDEWEDTQLMDIRTIEGIVIGSKLQIEEGDILQEDPFPEEEADSVDGDGDGGPYDRHYGYWTRYSDTGYDEDEASKIYQFHDRAAAIVVPKNCLAEFLKNISPNSWAERQHAMQWICRQYETHKNDQTLKEQMTELLYNWLSASSYLDDEPRTMIFDLAYKQGLESVIREWLGARKMDRSSSTPQFSSGTRRSLIEFITSKEASSTEDRRAIDWSEWLGDFFCCLSDLLLLTVEVRAFEGAIADVMAEGDAGADIVTAYTNWAVPLLEERLRTCNTDGLQKRSEDNVVCFIALACWRGGQWTVKNLVPFIENLGSDVFIAAFLSQMYDRLWPAANEKAVIEQTEVHELFRLLAENIRIVNRRNSSQLALSHAFNVARVIDKCLAFEMEESVRNIANQLIIDVQNCSSDFEFLRTLLMEMQRLLSARQNVDKELFGNVASAVLEKLINQRYKPRPTKPNGWPMKKRGCGCPHCDRLDRFLTAPEQRTARFTLDGLARKHLETQLCYAERFPNNALQFFSFDTDKSTRPCHTLVITKLRTEFERDLKDWQKDFDALGSDLTGLRSQFMKNLLGERYEDLIELRALKKSHQLAELTGSLSNAVAPTGSLKEGPNPRGSGSSVQGAGSKRKAKGDALLMPLAKKRH